MRKILGALLALCLWATCAQAQYTRVSGSCQNGNVSVTIPGTQGSGGQKFQQSFPSCTITVLDAGTVNVSTIYAASTGTSKANPFTAANNGQWFFYAPPGLHYDVTLSGGGMAAPFTLGDQVAPSPFNVPLNAQNYAGSDTFAKINTAISSSDCTNGCWIIDGKALTAAETISSGGIVFGKPVHLTFNGVYTSTSTAFSNGMFWVQGGAFPAVGASGSRIECNGYPQNITLGKLGNANPSGFIYTPSSSGPFMTLDENGGQLNDVVVSNCSTVFNSNVSGPVTYTITGGGMAGIVFRNFVAINSAVNTAWQGHAFSAICSRPAGPASGVEYIFDFDNVALYNGGQAINGNNTGNPAGDGVYIDPTAQPGGAACGFLGPSRVFRLSAEGLTGSYCFFAKFALTIDMDSPICNQNSFQTNGQGVHVENGSTIPALYLTNGQFDDNNWNNTTGIVDVSIPGGAAIISQNFFTGGTTGPTHAEDHAIDIGGSAIGVLIENNRITNYASEGTNISSGAGFVRYCGNAFAAGNGSSNEFAGSVANLPGNGCLQSNNGTDNILRFLNRAFGTRAWDWDFDSSGNFKLDMNASARMTFNGSSKVTFVDSPIIPFDADSGANIPLVMGFTGTQTTGSVHIVTGTATLNGASPSLVAVTLSGNAVFNASNSYVCNATDNSVGTSTSTNVHNTSGTVFTVYGPNGSVDPVNIICVGF